jgi:hypothetical protein
MMNRAEYEAVASAIHEADTPKGYRRIIALEIATALCATNDRFDPVRFMEQADLDVSDAEISGYSHALYLRTKTGVGAARNQIRSNG